MTESPGVLVLADGKVFHGTSIGAPGASLGEVVFTTSLSGYQEVLTDPSYADQIVTMTCAEIGNVGANAEDFESRRIFATGLVVRSARPVTSSWRAETSLRQLLAAQRVVAIQGVDTRALVLRIRESGAQMGIISSDDSDIERLVVRARQAHGMAGRDLAKRVTVEEAYHFADPPGAIQRLDVAPGERAVTERPAKIVVYDFGVKKSILRRLVEAGGDLTVVPATTSAEDVIAMKPDGVVFSNGPGDPEPCTYAIEAARKLVGRMPALGICLGHQILGIAYGAKSYKLKFGHRGANQPVRHEPTGRVMITSQNHGFAIEPDKLTGQGVRVTEINLNDGTLEGFEVPKDRATAIQYHPEASPGPHDSSDHFAKFLRQCREK